MSGLALTDYRRRMEEQARCVHDGHPTAHPARRTNSSGSDQLCIWCPVCEIPLNLRAAGIAHDGQWIGKHFATHTLGWAIDQLPTVGVARYHLCRKCREWVLCEFHHIAPRAVFKELADLFPVVPLCRSCHVAVEATWRTYLESWQRAA